MTTGKAILGMLVGVAAGAAIGMLLAPHKGDKTRKKIFKNGRALADAINEKIDDRFDDLVMSISKKMTSQSTSGQPTSNQEV